MSKMEITVVSDLHLGAGMNPDTATFSRHEEFFYDCEFALFLEQITNNAKESGRKQLLVLNGDVMDFLSVTTLPDKEVILKEGIFVNRNEAKFGLGSAENKAVWKTRLILQGHFDFFKALAGFLMAGHRIVYIRGNHDLEIYWDSVQEEIRSFLKERLMEMGSEDGSEIDNFEIRQWFWHEDGVYIEHGNQYDETNAITSPLCPVLPEGAYGSPRPLLEYPVGSLFARFVYGPIRGLDPYRTHVISLAQYLGVMKSFNIWDFIRTLHLNFPFFLRAARNSIEVSGSKLAEFLKKHIQRRSEYASKNGLPVEKVKKIDSFRALPLGHSGYDIFIRLFRPFLIQVIIFSILFFASVFGWILLFTTLSSVLSTSIFGKASTISVLAVLSVVGFFFLFSKVGKVIYSYEDPLVDKTKEIAGKIANLIDADVVVMGHTHVCERAVISKEAVYINTGTWIMYPGPWDLLKHRARQFTFARISDGTARLLQWDPVLRKEVAPVILEKSEKNPWEIVIGDDFIPPEEKNK